MLLIYSGGLYMLYQLHDFILSETQGWLCGLESMEQKVAQPYFKI
jgi:hypothetical protein